VQIWFSVGRLISVNLGDESCLSARQASQIRQQRFGFYRDFTILIESSGGTRYNGNQDLMGIRND